MSVNLCLFGCLNCLLHNVEIKSLKYHFSRGYNTRLFIMAISELVISLYMLVILIDVTKSATFHYKTDDTCLWTSPLSMDYMNPLPKVNITLDCREFGAEATIQVLNVYYIRQRSRGDTDCLTEKLLTKCCGNTWYTSDNKNCIVSIPENVYNGTIGQCNGNATCTSEMQAMDLNKYCGNCDSADTNAWTNRTCLSRLVEVRYICIQQTADCTTSTPKPAATRTETTQTTGVTTAAVVGTTGTRADGFSTTATQDMTRKEKSTAPLISLSTCENLTTDSKNYKVGLAVAVPLSLIVGSLVTFIILRMCSHDHKNAKKLDRMEMVSPETSTSNDYGALGDYVMVEDGQTNTALQDDYAAIGDNIPDKDLHQMVCNKNAPRTVSGKALMANNNASLVPNKSNIDQKAMTATPTAATGDCVEVATDGVGMVENDYYAGNNIPYKAEETFEENPYYEGMGENGVIERVKETGKEHGAREKNYVYTYGHFALEGRAREPVAKEVT